LVRLGTTIGVFPSWPEVSSGSGVLLSGVEFSVLELGYLMLLVWDHDGGFPDWVIDLRLGDWNVGGIWSSWRGWRNDWGGWAFAGCNDGIAQVLSKWDDLSGRRKIGNSGTWSD